MTGQQDNPPTEGSDRTEWAAVAMKGIVKLAATGRPFAAFELVSTCDVPEPPHPNCWGPLLAYARSQGLIVAVAAVPSPRPRTRKSLCRLWVGVGSQQTPHEEGVA